MVNIYDVKPNDAATLALNQNLIQSILSKHPTWTEKDVRHKIDEAFSVLKGKLGKMNGNKNKAVPAINDGAFCMECNSMNLTPTGSCRVCLDCGASQGCS